MGMTRRLRPSRTILLLAGVLLVAVAMRLRGLTFGLPALYDPDEGIFLLTGLKLLRDRTLNPGWFGHPGTTTIYALALIDVAVFAWGHWVTGALADTAAFGRAIYTDPGIVILPGRVFIMACGIGCIALTFAIARRLFDTRVAFLAAALLAIDPVHIRYSQIIRTDMQATLFILLVVLAAIRIVQRGDRRYFVAAGIALGFATATKWPAATAGAGVVAACVARWLANRGERRRLIGGLVLFGLVAVAALFVASPYLFLDTATVLDNLRGEERPHHLGATGAGLLFNCWWYIAQPLRLALGSVGVVLAGVGCWLGARRSRAFAAVVVVTAATFFFGIAVQNLLWERWVVPLLPLLTIAAAFAAVEIVRHAGSRWGRAGGAGAGLALGAILAVPVLLTANAQAAERQTDTRRLATDWLRAHVAPGDSVAVEYFAFDVLARPWRFLYPAGDRGCVDVRANLSGKIRYSTIGRWRGQRSVVDLGNIAEPMLATCRADWLLITNWDRYRAEASFYPGELATYRRLASGGTLAASFYPEPGRIGGPIVRVIHLPGGRAMGGEAR